MMWRRWPLVRLSAALVATLPAASQAEDVVSLASEDDPDAEVRLAGQVVDYTGRVLRVNIGGIEKSFPGSRVKWIDAEWSADQRAGDAAWEAGDYRLAATKYAAANRAETRVWVRRKLLADVIWCQRALGETERACDAFLLLLASDPDTPYFDSIPLAWTPTEAVTVAKAQSYLQKPDSPAAQLLGASHLLSGKERAAAIVTLGKLSTSKDRKIALLAGAQRWRTEAFRASPQQTADWAATLAELPAGLQAGPYVVIGQALVAQKRWPEAALAYLRAPILHPRGRDLSAGALWSAAESLRAAERPDEARRLWEELARDYPGRPEQAAARKRLEEGEKE